MNPCHGSVLVQVGAWKCVVTLSSHTLHMHISAAGFLIEISWASPLPVASFSRNTKAGRGWRGWGTLAVKPKRPSETQIYSRNGNWATTMPLSSKMTLALKQGLQTQMSTEARQGTCMMKQARNRKENWRVKPRLKETRATQLHHIPCGTGGLWTLDFLMFQ